jgi:hypothetical protein
MSNRSTRSVAKLSAMAIVQLALSGGCTATGGSRSATSTEATTMTASPAMAAKEPTVAAGETFGGPTPGDLTPGKWERTEDGVWVRNTGGKAPALTVNGVLNPTRVMDDVGGCSEMFGSRPSEEPVRLSVKGGPRTLYVFARARGPIGIGVAGQSATCATAGSNGWARLKLDAVSGRLDVDIADVDFPKERRGQTSPYIVVVSDDDAEPPNDPAPRSPVPPSDVVVRWAIDRVPCKDAMNTQKCMRASIELSGALKKMIPLKNPLVGQLDCWPSGTGAYCGGPSGSTQIALSVGRDGVVKVVATSMSDGYCPPSEYCSSRQTLASFKIPAGAALVPDPTGTWPPKR